MLSARVSDFVRNRRRAAGLTQVDLADRAGVGLRFVRDLEQGKPTVRCDKVNQVLLLFGHELAAEPIDREVLLPNDEPADDGP